MEQTDATAKTSTGPIFHDLAERFRKRGVVIVLSDLFDDVHSMLAGLKHFCYRRHDVIMLHVLDPAELEFPFGQTTLFKGMEDFPEVLADPRSIRQAYLKEFEKYREQVKRGCQAYGLDYRMLRTDEPLDVVLTDYLASRMNRVRG